MTDDIILVNVLDCSDECNIADGHSIKVTKVGQGTLSGTVDKTVHVVTLSAIYYAKDLAHDLIHTASLKKKERSELRRRKIVPEACQ